MSHKACLIGFALLITMGCFAEVKGNMFSDGFERRQGALCRGFRDSKEMALVFTGGEFGEGLETILDELKTRNLKAAFFFTGAFFQIEPHQPLIRRLVKEGHYLGPHSDGHLLLASWEDEKTLVTQKQFLDDLNRNIERCVEYGFKREDIRYWIPPYEHCNEEICRWSQDNGLTMINFTRGTFSHADYAPEGDKYFRPAEVIIQSIKDYPAKDPDGFNGFILLMHVGAGARKDKVHPHFGSIVDFLHSQGQTIIRVDELLDKGKQ